MVIIFAFLGCQPINEVEVMSPEGNVSLSFTNEDQMTYQVRYKDKQIILPSNLGLVFETYDFSSLVIESVEETSFSETWSPIWGQQSLIENNYNQVIVHLKERENNYLLDLLFRLYDDGLAFRYILPHQEGIDEILLMDEKTEFKIAEDTQTWWIRNDWNSYEYLYNETSLSETRDASTPVTMKFEDGTHISIHEAALIDYSGMGLKKLDDNTFESHLAPWPDGVKVKTHDSLTTPWRTIQIGDNAGDLAESSLILNLNEPLAYEDTSWIEPMKYMGIWWEMHIKKSDWGQHNLNHGATTENAKYYIDFIDKYLSSDEERIGLLVEGWNQGWDGNWIDNYDLFKFTEDGEYDDFDVSEVVAYGQERNVAYIMHNETSGGIENYDNAMDDAYADYQRLGINAIKSGYVADGGMKQPRGQHHHGQYMVNHYNNAVIKAAEYGIMINTHEPIKATGLSRTYPNWVAREGVQGMEYNAWSEGNPPEHTTILPFTRILGGPIDYTPGIFDVEIAGATYRVHTTRAKQLALYVVLYSPLQMITDLPENYLDESGQPYPEFKFVKDMKVDWDESHVLNAEIGDYVTIARKAKGTDEWFIGSITDEENRALEISLDFLDDQTYLAEVYTDALGTNYLTHPNSVDSYKLLVTKDDVLPLSLAAGGGTAIRLIPSGETLESYQSGELNVSNLEMANDLESNDLFTAQVSLNNTDSMTLGQQVNFTIDGEIIDQAYIRVSPNSQGTYTFAYTEFFEPGDYLVKVGDFEERKVTVKEKPATFTLEDYEVFTNGNKVMARAKVFNSGYHSGSYDMAFYINDELIETRVIEIEAAPGGKTKGITFRYDLPESGEYKIRVNNQELTINHEMK